MQLFGVGYLLFGAATTVCGDAVAHGLAELVRALTDRSVAPRERRRLRGAVRLLGVAFVLLGVLVLLGLGPLAHAVGGLLAVVPLVLLVRLARA